MRHAGIALAICALTGCATFQREYPAYGVREAIDNVATLKGKRIVVVGYLSECYRYGCAISEAIAGDQAKFSLGIGGWPKFDREAKPWAGRKVAIEADFTADCVDQNPNDDAIVMCTDRASSLENPKLIGPPNLVANRMNH